MNKMDKQSDEDIDQTCDETIGHQLSESVVSSTAKTRHKLSEINDCSLVYEKKSMERFGDEFIAELFL